MRELKIQRITFEEIEEFFNLDLRDRKFNHDDPDDPANILMLIYRTDSKEFEAVPVTSGGAPVLQTRLTADILSNQDWVVKKFYKAGMTFQEVMEQLLRPPMAATASLAAAPRIYDAWKDTTIHAVLTFVKGSAGKIVSIAAKFNGADITFTVDPSGESATADVKTGKIALGDHAHSLNAPIEAIITFEREPGSTDTDNLTVTFNTTAASPLIYGTSAGNDVNALTTLVNKAIDGVFESSGDEVSKAATAQNRLPVAFKPVPLKQAFHWVASTHKFTYWEDPNFKLNSGDIIDTHDVYPITTHGVTYYIHVTKAVTTYDNITLNYK